MKIVYMCEKCGTTWINEAAATECEGRHKDPIKYEVTKWSHERGYRDWPEMIKVYLGGVPPMEYDWAIYKLDHVGPRGL